MMGMEIAAQREGVKRKRAPLGEVNVNTRTGKRRKATSDVYGGCENERNATDSRPAVKTIVVRQWIPLDGVDNERSQRDGCEERFGDGKSAIVNASRHLENAKEVAQALPLLLPAGHGDLRCTETLESEDDTKLHRRPRPADGASLIAPRASRDIVDRNVGGAHAVTSRLLAVAASVAAVVEVPPADESCEEKENGGVCWARAAPKADSDGDATPVTLKHAGCNTCRSIGRLHKGDEDPSAVNPSSTAIVADMIRVQMDYRPRAQYLSYHKHITDAMRSILVDWLFEVQISFRLCDETVFLAVSMVDRYLSKRRIPRDRLQLVGATALFIASKYEEVGPPTLGDFVYVCADSYTREEFKALEHKMLEVLEYRIMAPTALFFLKSFAAVARADERQVAIAEYGLQLMLLKYKYTNELASNLACAALDFAADATDDPQLSEHAAEIYIGRTIDMAQIALSMKRSAISRKSVSLSNKFGSSAKMAVAGIDFGAGGRPAFSRGPVSP